MATTLARDIPVSAMSEPVYIRQTKPTAIDRKKGRFGKTYFAFAIRLFRLRFEVSITN